MTAYYNENDPKAAAWLRELIRCGHIAAGEVDERSITEVVPDDISGFDQCHFFAGIGGWSYALRLAGWPDDRPVWTGSCPCQPFSVAGKRKGTADKRHLWPEFARLIAQCNPAIVFGEQVASKDGREWLAGVRLDLEGMGYGVGAADLCAAGAGAPHIRQRLYWVADAGSERRAGIDALLLGRGSQQDCFEVAGRCETGGLADAMPAGRPEGWSESRRGSASGGGAVGRLEHANLSGEHGRSSSLEQSVRDEHIEAGALGNADIARSQGRGERSDEHADQRTAWPAGELGENHSHEKPVRSLFSRAENQSTACFWRDFDTIACTDGKSRRVESGTFPLAHGIPARMGRLRGYGNAIVPQVAAIFIECSP